MRKQLALAFGVSALMVSTAMAANITWIGTGAGTELWSDTSNWDLGVLPTEPILEVGGVDVVIFGNINVDITSGTQAQGRDLDLTNFADLTVGNNSNDSLHIHDDLTIANGATLKMDANSSALTSKSGNTGTGRDFRIADGSAGLAPSSIDMRRGNLEIGGFDSRSRIGYHGGTANFYIQGGDLTLDGSRGINLGDNLSADGHGRGTINITTSEPVGDPASPHTGRLKVLDDLNHWDADVNITCASSSNDECVDFQDIYIFTQDAGSIGGGTWDVNLSGSSRFKADKFESGPTSTVTQGGLFKLRITDSGRFEARKKANFNNVNTDIIVDGPSTDFRVGHVSAPTFDGVLKMRYAASHSLILRNGADGKVGQLELAIEGTGTSTLKVESGATFIAETGDLGPGNVLIGGGGGIGLVDVSGGSTFGADNDLTLNTGGGGLGRITLSDDGSTLNIGGSLITTNAGAGDFIDLSDHSHVVLAGDVTGAIATLISGGIITGTGTATGSGLAVDYDNAFGHDAAYSGKTVVHGCIDGDLNCDGEVNGADFLKWQREFTDSVQDGINLALWKSNYGAGALSAAAAATAAVPEPTSLMLVGIGLLGMGRRRRKVM